MSQERSQVEKLEKEEDLKKDDREEEMSLEEGSKAGREMKGYVKTWLTEKGFGFIEVKGSLVFCHKGKILGRDDLKRGEEVWLKVEPNPKKGKGYWQASSVLDEAKWKEREAKRKEEEAIWGLNDPSDSSLPPQLMSDIGEMQTEDDATGGRGHTAQEGIRQARAVPGQDHRRALTPGRVKS